MLTATQISNGVIDEIKFKLNQISIEFQKLKVDVMVKGIGTWIYNKETGFFEKHYDETTRNTLNVLSKLECTAIKNLAKEYGIEIKEPED